MKLGRWFDTEVSLDWSVALLLAYLAFSSYYNFASVKIVGITTSELIFSSALVVFGVLFSILAHEFGHVLVGRKYGVDFNSVILYAMGGAATMTTNMPNAKCEFFTALAGPAVSMILSFLFLLASVISSMLGLYVLVYPLGALFAINFNLAIFNLIPAFPLDGGRVLRAAVWKFRGDFHKATFVAASSGKCLGAGLAIVGVGMALGMSFPFFGSGLSSGIWVGVIGLLIIYMAHQEQRRAGYGS